MSGQFPSIIEQTDDCHKGAGRLGDNGEGIKQRKRKKKLVGTDNSVVITKGQGGWWEAVEEKAGINSDRRPDLRW